MSDATLSTVRNAARVLKAFRTREESLGVSELARRLELGKSNVHRLLTTLVSEGLVEQDPRSGGYRLGIVMFELGEAVKVHLDLHAAAGQVLAQLREQTGESSQVGVLDGDEVVYVDRLESAYSLRLFTETGRRVPAHCTSSGKVLLAHQSDFGPRAVPVAWPAAPPHPAHHHRSGRPARRAHRGAHPRVGRGDQRAGDRRGQPGRPGPRPAR